MSRNGEANSNYRHGLCVGGVAKIYHVWKDIVRRCTCPSHHRFIDYGARGIDIDPRWVKSVEVFIDDIGPRPSTKHSIDRIDNSKGYWPSNVRWATQTEQNNNTRANRRLTVGGETKTLSQWAKKLGVPLSSLHWRLQNGWSEESAITVPFRRKISD